MFEFYIFERKNWICVIKFFRGYGRLIGNKLCIRNIFDLKGLSN